MPKLTITINSNYNADVLALFCSDRAQQSISNSLRIVEKKDPKFWQQDAEEWLRLRDSFKTVSAQAKSTLVLKLKRKWFELIKSGEKTEEYREIKPYWDSRLNNRDFDTVIFENGYSQNAPCMRVELKNISKGMGRPEWGAPKDKPVYILQLGKILEVNKCHF